MTETAQQLDALRRIADRCLPSHADRVVVIDVGHGGTTQVFRANRGEATVFIRLAESAGEEMTVEAAVHERLGTLGVRLPPVVAVEPAGQLLDRGALVLAQMPGRPYAVAGRPSRLAMRELGADLGRISTVPVNGFGFLERNVYPPFTARFASGQELLVAPLAALRDGIGVDDRLAEAAHEVITADGASLVDGPSRLAHGDLDLTHVYAQGKRYAGIIDFGEARGAPLLYDVAHLALHQPTLTTNAMQSLIEGYSTVADVPRDWEQRVRALGVVIGVMLLGLTRGRDQHAAYRDQLATGLAALIAAA
jgi:Ser/Thr protein kinase RdoA (MazF antagonist)